MNWLNSKKRACLLSVIGGLTLMMSGIPALAQGTVRLTEYSAKFLCGTESPTTNPFGLGQAVRPATYATSINIHNPGVTFGGITDPPIDFLKKAVLSAEEGKPLNQPSGFQKDVLPADFVEEVDCPVIYSLLHIPPGPFIEGYVVLYAFPLSTGPAELDVTDVITATPATGFGITTEIQTISPRFRM